MIKVTIKGLDSVEKIPERVYSGLFRGMQEAMELVERHVKDVYLSGRALNQRSGRLKHAVEGKVKAVGKKMTGTIGLKYPVPYGALWEFGGFIPPHIIVAKRKKALRWIGKDGQPHFAKKVSIPGHYVMPRPFIRPALLDKLAQMAQIMAASTEKANE